MPPVGTDVRPLPREIGHDEQGASGGNNVDDVRLRMLLDFAVEGWFGFHGLFGFVACVALVLAATALRRILKRPADYYDAR